MRRILAGIVVLSLAALVAVCAPLGLDAQDKSSAIDVLLTGYWAAHALNGAALVSDHGKVILEKGYGYADFEWKVPNTPDTKFRLGSITKQFTATLVMQLVEEGKLSTTATLASVLPYYRKDTGSRVTIHHLLTHTSGIPSYTSLPNFEKDISRNPYGVREFVEKFCSGDLEFEPGSKFVYDNSGYFILGAILEQVTGKPYAALLHERVLEPLGMRSTGYDLSEPILEKRARAYEQGFGGVRNAEYLDMTLPYSAGSLYSTVEDLYLWDQALYGEKVLSAKAKERMFTPNLENYGYGLVMQRRPIGPDKAERLTISHGGGINGFNTVILRVPEDRQLVVILNNTGGTTLNEMASGILDILYGRTPPPARPSIGFVLYQTIRSSGPAAAVAQFEDIRKTRPGEYLINAAQLNRLGDDLEREKRPADALAMFKLSVELDPSNRYAAQKLEELAKR